MGSGLWGDHNSQLSPPYLSSAYMFNALELKVPPLALVFLFGALMWLVSAYSMFTIAMPWHSAFALIFYTVGSATVLADVLTFRRMKTTVNPLTPEATTTMVTSGIYVRPYVFSASWVFW